LIACRQVTASRGALDCDSFKQLVGTMAKNSARNVITAGVALALSGAAVGWLVGLSVSPVVHIILASVISLVAGAVSGLAGLKSEGASEAGSDTSEPKPARYAVDPRPMMFMLVGLALGSALGINARTNGWFSTDLQAFVTQWRATGLPDTVIARRLFDQMYPSSGGDLERVSPPGPFVPAEISGLPTPSPVYIDQPGTNAGTASNAPGPRPDTPAVKPKLAATEKPPGKTSAGKAKPDGGSSTIMMQQHGGVLFSVTDDECAWMREVRDDYTKLKSRMTSTGDADLRRQAEKCRDLGCLQQLLERACPRKP
jgi:hypothetical protein